MIGQNFRVVSHRSGCDKQQGSKQHRNFRKISHVFIFSFPNSERVQMK
jgi:hypothetical protein